MGGNRRFGWHSGTMHCRDAKIMGDLYIQDDIIFSDVSAGELGVTGGIDMTATTSAYALDINGATIGTADIRLNDAGTIAGSAGTMTLTDTNIALVGAISVTGDVTLVNGCLNFTLPTWRAIRIGTKASAATSLPITATSFENEPGHNYLFGLFTAVADSSAATSKDELRSAWIRTRVNDGMDVGSNAGWGFGVCGAEIQLKIYADTAATEMHSWQNSAVWAQLETQGDGGVEFKTGSYSQAVLANVGLTNAATTIDAGAVVAGVTINSNTGSTVTDTGGFYGLFITDKSTTNLDFQSGIYLGDDVATTGMTLGNCTTGILVAGDCGSYGIHFTGDQATAIYMNFATAADAGLTMDITDAVTVGAGIRLDGSGTYTDGILLDGDVFVSGINLTGNFTSYGIVMDVTNGGTFDTGIHIYGATSKSIYVAQAMVEDTKPVDIIGLPGAVDAGSRQGVVAISASRETAWTSSDGNSDTGLKIRMENNSASSTYCGVRAIDAMARNDDANASCGVISGMYITAENDGDVGTSCVDMQVGQFIMSNQGVVTTNLYGIRVLENSEGTIPTDTVGIKVTTSTNAPASGSRADGMMITTGGASGGWTDGLHIAGTITNAINIAGTHTNAISISACETGVTISGTFTAVNSRAFISNITVNNAVYGDGYSANEFQLNLTGSSTGHIACAGAWINATSAGNIGAGGNYIAAQTNGIYQRTSTITGAKIIFGMRMAHDCAGTDAAGYYPFSIVSAGGTNDTTALFECNAAAINMGAVTDAGSDDGVLVPLYQEAGANIGYVKIYSLS